MTQFFRTTQHSQWRTFIAEVAYFSYTKVFADRGFSGRFAIRSLLVYLFLVLGSFVFLEQFFPTTAEAIFSVWKFGSAYEVASWCACVLLGGGVYILANAQTLYFLEILRSSPSFFKFFLVAYADFLITSSIGLFGVAALMTLHSFNVLLTTTEPVPIEFTFSSEVKPATSEMVDLLSSVKGVPIARVIQERRNLTIEEVALRYAVSPKYILAHADEYKTALVAIRRGLVKGKVLAGGTIVFERRPLLQPETGDARANVEKPGGTALSKIDGYYDGTATGCQRLIPPELTRGPFVLVTITREQRKQLIQACNSKNPASVALEMSLNTANIIWGVQYESYVINNLNNMIESLRTGFGAYLEMSPYSFIAEPQSASWRDSGVPRTPGQAASDTSELNQGLLKMLAVQNGDGFMFAVRSLPGGTLNFAIMSTSVFLALVMSLAAMTFPLVLSVERLSKVSSLIDLGKNPFAVAGAIVGFWASLWVMAIRLI